MEYKHSAKLVQLLARFHHKNIPHGRTEEGPALFDTGANASFISWHLVRKFGLEIISRPKVIKNGDGSLQQSPGFVNICVSLGRRFKANFCLQVAHLDRYDMIIGTDYIFAFEMQLEFRPFRVTAIRPVGLGANRKTSNRVNLPTCIRESRDADGRDTSSYVCDTFQFNSFVKEFGYTADDVLALVPDQADGISYNLLMQEIVDLAGSDVSASDFREQAFNLFNTRLSDLAIPTKTRASALPQSGEGESDIAMTGMTDQQDGTASCAPSQVNLESASGAQQKFSVAPNAHSLAGREAIFRDQIVNDFPELCSDTLPTEGPSATLPDGTPYKVKLKVREGTEPTGRRQFRIPEAYRPELEKIIDDLFKFKLIEPSISPYSNPVFLVPKPPRPDGSYAGLRFVFDGRGINRALEYDAHMIPRVEDLIDRVARLKYDAERAGVKRMIISTIDQRTSFWQLALDEESRPLTAFSTSAGSFQWTCLPMGVLTASAHLQRFTEALLRPFSSSNTFEYEDKQGGICQAFGTAMGYIDDLCIVTFGDEHVHEILLRRVLTAMEKCKLRIQHKKCEFFREQAAFLGHVLSSEGISQQESKLEAIRNWPALSDLKSVRAFVSLCSYYRKFVKDFARIATPLTNLMKADGWHKPFRPEVLESFEKLKTALTSAPVLAYFDVNAHHELFVDASGYAMGAVLQQLDDAGNSRPVGYYSRRLTSAEQNKSAYERELLGLRDACLHFRHQLLGIPFDVRTDHCSLRHLHSQKELSGQVARIMAVLADFRINEITHVPGVKNVVGDALSRYPDENGPSYEHLMPEQGNMEVRFSRLQLEEQRFSVELLQLCSLETLPETSTTTPTSTEDTSAQQLVDALTQLGIETSIPSVSHADVDAEKGGYPEMSMATASVIVKQFRAAYSACNDFKTVYGQLRGRSVSDMPHPTYPDYSINQQGMLIFFDGSHARLCVPTAYRNLILKVTHDLPLGAHFGQDKLRALLMTRFYFPHMSSRIDAYVRSCEHCQRNKSYTANRRGVPQPHKVPLRRFDVISIDIMCGFPPTTSGQDGVVVFTDRLTKRIWIEPVSSAISAAELAHIFFRTVFRTQGLPRKILSDRGPQFISEFWHAFFKLLKTDIRLTSSYHPQANGGTERANRTLLESLRCFVNARQDNWSDHLVYFEFAYNNSVNPATGYSPFVLMFAQSPRAPYDALLEGSDSTKQIDSDNHLARDLGFDIMENLQDARDKLHRAAQQFRERHARSCKPHTFAVGDEVLLSSENVKLSLPCRKLSPAFVGPFKIVKLCGRNAVEIESTGRWKALQPMINIEYLRPYRKRTEDVGPLPKHLSVKPLVVEPAGDWYEIEAVLNHRGRPHLENQQCLVRWRGTDASQDSWVPRRDINEMALIEYERNLTEQANRAKGHKMNQLLKSFIGTDGACSVIAARANAASRNKKRTAKKDEAEAATAAASAASARAAAPMGSSSASDGRRARNKPVLFKPG